MDEGQAPPEESKEQVSTVQEVVTKEMKLEFCQKVKKLSNKGLASLVLKVKQVKATSVRNLPEDKMQIRVDDFDKSDFTQISDHVDELLLTESTSKRQRT